MGLLDVFALFFSLTLDGITEETGGGVRDTWPGVSCPASSSQQRSLAHSAESHLPHSRGIGMMTFMC